MGLVDFSLSVERREIGRTGVHLEFADGLLHAVQLPPDRIESFDARALELVLKATAGLDLDWRRATPFTQAVWRRMMAIPAGETLTYGELAGEVRCIDGARAVGSAVGRNLLLIIVPCHRVLARNGLGGFREGLAWKQRLLQLERAVYGTEHRPAALAA